ncbi:MAG: family 78 glycoside hydrolase catalytic domain [Clostridia bacterium]|nr:family 78 glycoside hydrolase catalytic domain [Clostridia bacterium]
MVKNIWGADKNEVFLRSTFFVKDDIVSAYARIYADTGYELWINGRFVAFVDEWVNTRDYNVRLFLKQGENTVAVHGLNHGGHRGVAFELAVNGSSVLNTDETWKSCDEEKWGWMLPSYDDSFWRAPDVLDLTAACGPQWTDLPGSDAERVVPTLDGSLFFGGNIPKSVSSPYYTAGHVSYTPDEKVVSLVGKNYRDFVNTPHLPEIHIPSVISCTAQQKEGKIFVIGTSRYTGEEFVLDFGGETLGYLRMRISSESSLSLRVHYAETLDEALSEVPRDRLQHRMLNEEYRVFGGLREFECRSRVGFRYARVEVFDAVAPVELWDFAVRTQLYPVVRKGYFECDDDMLNRLWQMGERTLHFCMQEWYVDAPKRDRFLWTGDTRMQALINYYTFGDTALFEYSWDSLAGCQYENGGIPSLYGKGCSALLDYTALYVIAYYDYYMYTGNWGFAVKNLDSIISAADFLSGFADESGLINVIPNPLGKKWMVLLTNTTGYDAWLNELYVRSLAAVKLFAELAGRSAEAEKFNALYKKSHAALMDMDCESKLFETYDSTKHSIIHYELAELEATHGCIDKMLDRIRKYWYPMAESGADCTYEGMYGKISPVETKTAVPPDFTSYCHGWSGGPTVLMPKGLLGIAPLEPGFARVRVKPEPGSLKYIKSVVPTPRGEMAFCYEDGVLGYHLPQGITGSVELNDGFAEISGDGKINC